VFAYPHCCDVPAGDHEIVAKVKISKDDINMMERPLEEAAAATHLLRIARTLEHLTALVFF
jgi:hypothetical protein